MMKGWGSLRKILLLLSIFVGLYLPAPIISAQEIFFNWEPFQPQTELAPTTTNSLPLPGNNRGKPGFLTGDILDSDSAPPTQLWKKEDGQQEKVDKWAIRNWGLFSLSLSTLRNRIPKHDISGPVTNEKSRWEMMRSLTSDFSDMPSRERFQYFGEIFEPELKLGIEF